VTVDRHGATSALENPRDAALGVSDGQFRTSGTHRLPSGSTLLLLTDGLYERRGLDLDECFSRLRATISESAHLPLDDMCDELLRRAPHDDDIALIALRARPRAHP
jgi:serine phosphatase RsbU (regulator of sigma subunit)